MPLLPGHLQLSGGSHKESMIPYERLVSSYYPTSLTGDVDFELQKRACGQALQSLHLTLCLTKLGLAAFDGSAGHGSTIYCSPMVAAQQTQPSSTEAQFDDAILGHDLSMAMVHTPHHVPLLRLATPAPKLPPSAIRLCGLTAM